MEKFYDILTHVIFTEATTEPVEGRYGGHATTLLYGVFTTPENSIPGSAVCAFTFQDIMDTFEGPFKGQASVNANWLPVQGTKVSYSMWFNGILSM